MERLHRLRPAIAPSVAIVLIAGLLSLLAFSLTLQPPREAGADSVQQLLGWARAGLFTAGALAFLLGLAVSMGGSSDTGPWPLVSAVPAPRAQPAAFTLVALGGTPDDTRAIADAFDAAEAVMLLWQWSNAHPEEHVVVFNADAEPVAFKRPMWSARVLRQGAA